MGMDVVLHARQSRSCHDAIFVDLDESTAWKHLDGENVPLSPTLVVADKIVYCVMLHLMMFWLSEMEREGRRIR